MELLLLAGAVIITGAVFLWLVRVIKATLKTALLIAAIVFGLQFFGIGRDRIFAQVQQIVNYFWRFVPGQQSFDLESIMHQVTKIAYLVLEPFSS
ncbi:hypothetical protein ACQ4M3_14020 [Leptolyngbya sp. AN03gr2]|uniref:hypothetical protein n=1 Tax=unclassified Leptolyngbya TaxID=2650499 RepID=UPI003D31B98B